jgi:CrcB protein
MTLLFVVLGAAVGAPLRYLADRFVQSRHVSRIPWGTWTVNVAGAFVLGVVVAAWPDGPAMALLGTGLCGALTTWSTFGFETVRLLEDEAYGPAVAYVAGSLVAGVLSALLGMLVARIA